MPLERLKDELDPRTLSTLKLTDEEIVKLWGRREGVKIPVQVRLSATLSIHHADHPQIAYKLKGVIIHSGRVDTGHYYTYLPVEEPPSYVLHNDQRVVQVPDSENLKKELEQEGYILIYDKED